MLQKKDVAMDIGAELRAARESKGLTLATLAQRTRVQPRILEAIESNNLAAIPPKPFGRGFVRNYAKEVDLDPSNVVHNYFAQFPPEPAFAPDTLPAPAARFESSSHWTGFGAAIAILVVLVAAAALRAPGGVPPAEPGAVGKSGAASKPGVAPPAATTPESPAPAAAVPAAVAPVRLAFTVTRPCWVTARVDGQRVIYKIVVPGESQTLDAQREIVVRFGDAGAVQATINGRQSGPLGADGTIRDLRVGPETVDSR
jgi:cytoskeleton protein RodZ